MSPGLWHRTMVYLGLRDEPEDGYDELGEHFGTEQKPRRRTLGRSDPEPMESPPSEPDLDAIGNVRPLHTGDVQVVRPETVGSPSTAPLRTPVVEVLVFDDVEQVGSRYRTGQPVLFDLGKAERDVARRVIDFVSGLTFISRGQLTKVGDRAFLLVPEGIELPADERHRLGGLGYDVSAGSGS